jgi:hypothetical protein
MTWREAYLEQARSDFAMYRRLMGLEPQAPVHDQLHYLQMGCEKLAKAALLATGANVTQLVQSHVALSRLLNTLKHHKRLGRHFGMGLQQWQAMLRAALPSAHAIEYLAPALSDGGPNVEYPWELPTGEVEAPCRHPWHEDPRRHGRGQRLIELVAELLERFEELFR